MPVQLPKSEDSLSVSSGICVVSKNDFLHPQNLVAGGLSSILSTLGFEPEWWNAIGDATLAKEKLLLFSRLDDPQYYTCDKQVLWESAGAFFRATTVSARKSHSSGVRGLVVRCLLFNSEGSCSNPCLCANFFTSIPKQKVLIFLALRPLPPFRL